MLNQLLSQDERQWKYGLGGCQHPRCVDELLTWEANLESVIVLSRQRLCRRIRVCKTQGEY